MRVLVFLLLGSGWISCHAQAGYSVWYAHDIRLAPITINGQNRNLPGMTERLLFSDSLSLSYRLPGGTTDPMKKKSIFGPKLIHHAILFNSNSGNYFSEVAWPSKKNQFLIRDSLKSENWVFLPDRKEIMGYPCRPALRVNERNDSTLVWFTDSLPRPFGPFLYIGFPGLVLEVFDQQNGWHLQAKKIVAGDIKVLMPENVRIIPREEYISPKQKK